MSKPNVTGKIEIREAIHPEGGQSLVLFVAMLDDGTELVVPLLPSEARTAAATMVRFADDIDQHQRASRN